MVIGSPAFWAELNTSMAISSAASDIRTLSVCPSGLTDPVTLVASSVQQPVQQPGRFRGGMWVFADVHETR
jgi:hypothetical protein